MEKHLRESFENLTMPEDCEQRIARAMAEKQKKSVRPVWARALAAAAALALVMFIGVNFETVKVYAEEALEHIIHTLNPEETKPLGKVGEDLYVSYGGLISYGGDEEDFDFASVKANDSDPAEVRDGRLYFIANGENMDITDLCSMDTAYIYTLEDDTGILHYIIVGGTPDNWGYQIFMKDPSCADGDPWGWIAGGGANGCGEDSDWEPYGWVVDAKERIDHPWPI